MLKLEIILAENDVMKISEGLKEIGVGGLTVIKVRGRGAKTASFRNSYTQRNGSICSSFCRQISINGSNS